MSLKGLSQQDAQQRINQIDAFYQELGCVEKEEALQLDEEQKSILHAYHHKLKRELKEEFDVDTTAASKQLSIGIKIASLFGALAISASVFFLFYQFWGYIATPLQVVVLFTAPLVTLGLTYWLSQKDEYQYYSKIVAFISLSCFVLNLSMFGQLFNMEQTPNAFLAWSVFGFLLAYLSRAKLLLFFALVALLNFMAMKFGTWSGMYWIHFGERPENFLIPALVIFALPLKVTHRRFADFDMIYRIVGLIAWFLPVLILSNWAYGSYVDIDRDLLEGLYQVLGFGSAGLFIWLGIKKHWQDTVNTANVFLILFLYTKFFDWWWDWMPKYIFFFLLGVIALLMLMVFQRLRKASFNKQTVSDKEEGEQ